MAHPENNKLEIHADGSLSFYCPGCETYHQIIPDTVAGVGPRWKIRAVNPLTVEPSVLVRYGNMPGSSRCHFFIRNGHFQYLNDCTHELAGQMIEMEAVH